MTEAAIADAFSAIDRASFLTLSTAIDDVTVLQHAPKDTQLPLVLIGDIDDAQRLGGKGGRRDRRVPLEILVLTQGEERGPCSAILGRVELALDGETIAVPGWLVTFELDQSGAALTEEGDAYVGLARFIVFARPADPAQI